jgi:phosphate transport system substrate-binding protein
MNRHLKSFLPIALLLLLPISDLQSELGARQHVHIVGSSTAYPIIAAAAEFFGKHTSFPTPIVEAAGTGGGIKLFCSGVGPGTPDILMASRRMKESERRICEANDVIDIREIKIGFDCIVFASHLDAPKLALNRRDIYLAISRWVPSPTSPGEMIENPFESWSQIDSRLPDLPIRIYGPPPTSGTRDILVERLLTDSCLQEESMRELFKNDPSEFQNRCHAIREDSAFIEAGENEARLVRKLINDSEAVAILGFNFLQRDFDRIQAATIDGIAPTFESVESGIYSLTRPLYLYVKKAHDQLAVGLAEFLDLTIAIDSIGPDGRLLDHGLIPLQIDEQPDNQTVTGGR